MKDYVKKGLEDFIRSKKRVVEIKLKSRDDFKKGSLRLLYNKFILFIQTRIVPSHFKNLLLRTTGLNVGYDACIPHYIKFDPYFPELIDLGSGCLVGGDTTIITHQLKGKTLRLGKVDISERTLVGGLTTLKPGFRLNKDAMLMFFSEAEGVIPSGELWGGEPAKKIKKFTPEEIEKFHKRSTNDPAYYSKFRREVKEFLKDPTRTYFKIHYDGKRLNAGNDWWRARNVFRIWWNGILVELTVMMPHSFLKTLLLRMVGIKIGKNCKIAKGVVFDHLYGDNITLEDDVTIEENVYLDGHEYTITQTVFGKTLLKQGVVLKKNSYVRVGTTIGEKTIIEENSWAQKEIPPNQVWGGRPAEFLRNRKNLKTPKRTPHS